MTDLYPAPDEALAEMLCFAIYSTDHAFSQLYRQLLGPIGLTYPQYLVMRLLWSRDDRTVGDLGKALRLQSNTLTPLLKRLEAMSLVDRRRDAEDERVVRISLTPSGEELRQRAAGVTDCIAKAAGLTRAEANEAIDRLNRLRDGLAAAVD